MDASRCASALPCGGPTDEAAGLYPACFAGQSLRALMDFADPRLISPESSKLGTSFRLGGALAHPLTITRCSSCATFYRAVLFLTLIVPSCHPTPVEYRAPHLRP